MMWDGPGTFPTQPGVDELRRRRLEHVACADRALRVALRSLIERHGIEAANYTTDAARPEHGRDWIAGWRAGIATAYRTFADELDAILERTS